MNRSVILLYSLMSQLNHVNPVHTIATNARWRLIARNARRDICRCLTTAWARCSSDSMVRITSTFPWIRLWLLSTPDLWHQRYGSKLIIHWACWLKWYWEHLLTSWGRRLIWLKFSWTSIKSTTATPSTLKEINGTISRIPSMKRQALSTAIWTGISWARG